MIAQNYFLPSMANLPVKFLPNRHNYLLHNRCFPET